MAVCRAALSVVLAGSRHALCVEDGSRELLRGEGTSAMEPCEVPWGGSHCTLVLESDWLLFVILLVTINVTFASQLWRGALENAGHSNIRSDGCEGSRLRQGGLRHLAS